MYIILEILTMLNSLQAGLMYIIQDCLAKLKFLQAGLTSEFCLT